MVPRQGARQTDPHLALLVGREEVDDPVDGLGRRGGVQRGEHEVPGLRRGQRGVHGLRVAHLADQDHVGVLAEDRPHGGAEAVGVEPDLALVDGGEVVLVEVLDRVLDGDDVARPHVVDVVHHRRQRRGLARTGRPGDEDEPTVVLAEAAHDVGQAKVLECRRVGLHPAHGQGDRRALVERVGAEPPEARNGVGEVGLPLLLEGGEDLGAA